MYFNGWKSVISERMALIKWVWKRNWENRSTSVDVCLLLCSLPIWALIFIWRIPHLKELGGRQRLPSMIMKIVPFLSRADRGHRMEQGSPWKKNDLYNLQGVKLSDFYIQREKALSPLRSFLYKHDSYAIQTISYEIQI